MARNRAAPKPAPIVVQHENVEGGATYGINRWNRYKLVSDHKIYEDEQKEFKISRCPNFWVDDANVPKDVYDSIEKKAEGYWGKGFRFDLQWMVDYLCDNWIREDDGDVECHTCGKRHLENDTLFPCRYADKECKRFTHHRYKCSKSGIHGAEDQGEEQQAERDGLPDHDSIEALWCCWECMFKKNPTQAWRDEKVMTEALREYRVKQWRKAEGARKKQEREMRKALTRPRTLASQPSQQINKRPTREAEVTDEGDIDAMMAMLD